VNPVTYDILTQRVKQLGNLPAMPAILSTLTTALSFRPARSIWIIFPRQSGTTNH
jgi:hypothetical protein